MALPGPDKQTPLIIAASNDSFKCVKFLIESENCGKILKRDKFRRTALTMAVRSGHADIVSYLLNKGADYDDPDSSKNYPLHYACAFGWPEIIDLLIKAGAQVNVQND
mmetsp:Transcript_26293/g.12359  ORF Transcript_26293/g.12359 Transcript_26293/m.12359 type:complete len:108 (+) Transcript_26293:171-494(+)